MRVESRVTQELREWARRPSTITGTDAAHSVLARLGARTPQPRRGVLRPVLAAAVAALITAVALFTGLRGRGAHPVATGTTAAFTLSSGTQVVIELSEVKP